MCGDFDLSTSLGQKKGTLLFELHWGLTQLLFWWARRIDEVRGAGGDALAGGHRKIPWVETSRLVSGPAEEASSISVMSVSSSAYKPQPRRSFQGLEASKHVLRLQRPRNVDAPDGPRTHENFVEGPLLQRRRLPTAVQLRPPRRELLQVNLPLMAKCRESAITFVDCQRYNQQGAVMQLETEEGRGEVVRIGA